MLELFRRLDRAWARTESWLIVVLLIVLLLTAGLATVASRLDRLHLAGAGALAAQLAWADWWLRHASLWLAFLGASLAAHRQQHRHVGVLLRAAPPAARYKLISAASFITAAVAAGLVVCLSSAVYLNLGERPTELDLLGDDGQPLHVCDATREQLRAMDLDRPDVFCATRAMLRALGLPSEQPGAVLQLVVPFALAVIALRFLGRGVSAAAIALGGPERVARADADEQARAAARREAAR